MKTCEKTTIKIVNCIDFQKKLNSYKNDKFKALRNTRLKRQSVYENTKS